jgi:photoactive yellow protein
MVIETIDKNEIDNVLAHLKPGQLDKLAFGAVQLDATGKILAYNSAEGDITGRNPKDVIGKNFFKEIAPCTRTPKFEGVFKKGVQEKNLSAVFDYVFDYNMKPTQVRVQMKKAMSGDTYWIFIKRLAVLG